MAFQLKPEESIRKGLRRVLRKELKAAIRDLRANRLSDERVHEGRKHIKKARAVIRLVERSTNIKKAPDCLRHAGRLLSALRDSKAIVEEADELCSSDRRACLALRDILKQQTTHSRSSAKRHRAVEHATAALGRALHSVKAWDWSDIKDQQLNEAIQRSYKRARRSMLRTKATNDAKLFHEWRKATKLLAYALRLLENTVPVLHRQRSQLERVETWLGHDHNLLVLGSKAQDKLPPSKDKERISMLVSKRQRQLRRMALKVGATLFKDSPKAFGKRLRTIRRRAENS